MHLQKYCRALGGALTSGAGNSVWGEGLPDDVLANVGGDEQTDAGAEAVPVLKELVEADHDHAGEEELHSIPGTQREQYAKCKQYAGQRRSYAMLKQPWPRNFLESKAFRYNVFQTEKAAYFTVTKCVHLAGSD